MSIARMDKREYLLIHCFLDCVCIFHARHYLPCKIWSRFCGSYSTKFWLLKIERVYQDSRGIKHVCVFVRDWWCDYNGISCSLWPSVCHSASDSRQYCVVLLCSAMQTYMYIEDGDTLTQKSWTLCKLPFAIQAQSGFCTKQHHRAIPA